MRRILVLVTVLALMVVMMVVTVAPAFAAKPDFHPTPANSNATDNPAGDVTTCTVDPVCSNADTGQAHHEPFPKGQDIAFGD
jgi:hypothetical protein